MQSSTTRDATRARDDGWAANVAFVAVDGDIPRRRVIAPPGGARRDVGGDAVRARRVGFRFDAGGPSARAGTARMRQCERTVSSG
jgi:hypothetical protein